MAPTTVRNIRIPDDLWTRIGAVASESGTTSSALIKLAVAEYLDRRKPPATIAGPHSAAPTPQPPTKRTTCDCGAALDPDGTCFMCRR